MPLRKSFTARHRFGLTKQDYHGPRLLRSLPQETKAKESNPRPRSPEDVFAAPIGSSEGEDELCADTKTSSGLSDIDADSLPSPPKKRKLGKVRAPQNGAASHLNRPNYVEPSNIPHSTFAIRDKGNWQDKIESSDDELFGSFTLSQGRARNTYSKRFTNFHAAAPSPKKVKDEKKNTSAYAKCNAVGFKTIDTDACMAKLNDDSMRLKSNGWEGPNNLIIDQRTNKHGSRRSLRNLTTHENADNRFQVPPVTSPETKTSDDEKFSRFKIPSNLPDGRQKGEPIPFKAPPKLIPPGLSKSTRKAIDKLIETVRLEPSERDSFIVPAIDDVVSCTSSLSSPPSSPRLNASHLEHRSFLASPSPEHHSPPPKARCPFCNTPVAPSLLSSFIDEHTTGEVDDRLDLRRQALFCRLHKTESALIVWKSKGYPTIDWPNFPNRLKKHHTTINKIINEQKNSVYRHELEQRVMAGMKRNINMNMQNAGNKAASQTGYYGSKGARAMMEHLVSSFSRPIRRLAKTDRLIVASGGLSVFVHAVLVPELAVSLVREDMNVDEEEARQIIKESSDLGELLNEEEEEVVTRKKKDERRGESGVEWDEGVGEDEEEEEEGDDGEEDGGVNV